MNLLRLINPFIAVVLILFSCSVHAGGGEWIYAVKPGDTIIGVANDFLANPDKWEVLSQLNKVDDPKHLNPGTRLKIPVSLLKRTAAMAEIVHIHGDAHKIAQQSGETRLEVGSNLIVGDTVKTGADSSVTLRFSDGSRLLLLEKSTLILEQHLVFGKTGMAQTILGLRNGGMETQVRPQLGPAARYEIKSPVLNLGVRGTEFRARVMDGGGRVSSEVLTGGVNAKGKKSSVLLKAGFGTVAVKGEAPAIPKKLAAAPDLGRLPALQERLPLRFELPDVAGVSKFHAQIFSDRSFSNLLRDGVFSGHVAKWADLPDGKYVLRVRAIDVNGLEGLNSDHDFALKARPEPPFIVSPDEGRNVYGPQALLRWAKSTAASGYHVQVSAQKNFSVLLADVSNSAGTELELPLSPGVYFWRVASVAAGTDQGPYSDIQSFIQKKIPESPTLAAPELNDKQLTMRWRNGEEGSKYEVQLARDSGFEQLELDKLVAENTLSMARPKGGIYFMRVKAIEADGFAGPYGPAQQIDVPGFSWWWLLPALLLAF